MAAAAALSWEMVRRALGGVCAGGLLRARYNAFVRYVMVWRELSCCCLGGCELWLECHGESDHDNIRQYCMDYFFFGLAGT